MVFVGVKQRNEEINGRMKSYFVIKFRDDDELKEEIHVEPTTAADFESVVLNSIRQPSAAELVMRRMREVIKEVNPTFLKINIDEVRNLEPTRGMNCAEWLPVPSM